MAVATLPNGHTVRVSVTLPLTPGDRPSTVAMHSMEVERLVGGLFKALGYDLTEDSDVGFAPIEAQ